MKIPNWRIPGLRRRINYPKVLMNFTGEADANQKSWLKTEAKQMNPHSFLFSSNACLELKWGPHSSGLRSSWVKLLQRDKGAFVLILAKHDLVTGSSPGFFPLLYGTSAYVKAQSTKIHKDFLVYWGTAQVAGFTPKHFLAFIVLLG